MIIIYTHVYMDSIMNYIPEKLYSSKGNSIYKGERREREVEMEEKEKREGGREGGG